MHFQGEGSSKVLTNMDASVTAGGTGHGTSPMELLLMTIAGCSGMDIVTILDKMKVKVHRFETTVEGNVPVIILGYLKISKLSINSGGVSTQR